MSARVPLAVLGSSGLLAGELLRLVEGHPGLELAAAGSREPGVPLARLHPQLSGELVTVDPAGVAAVLAAAVDDAPDDVPAAGSSGRGGTPRIAAALVLGLPHGRSAAAFTALAAELGERLERVAVVDLSADFRLRDAALHERWYGAPPADPTGALDFRYGLPELFRTGLAGATRLAAPGCFATAMQLSVLPLARAGVLDVGVPWILHGVTGSSGSGAAASAGTHHPHRQGNLRAYAPDGHRHEAELAQALALAGVEASLHFLPHSGPFSRGIHLTAALPLAERLTTAEAHALLAEAYAGEPFVRVLPAGGVPELRSVVGSNRADLAVHARGDVLTVLCAIDNTLKGGAGQALQGLNLLLGLDETAGLPRAGLGY